MLRGLDNFAGGMDDDISSNKDANNTENEASVSVNFADDIKEIPNRRVSKDTDTESFTYEHFPVVCPTCRGTGRVHEDDVNELVAFVPVKDERLRPSRIFWKMLIMLLVCACIAGPLAFVLIPRSVQITVYDIKSTKIEIPTSRNSTAYIILKTHLEIKNQNYLTVKVANIDMQVNWNKILLNHGLCNQNITFSIPSRDSLKKSLDIKIYFKGTKIGTAGFQIRDVCAGGWFNHILVHFSTTAKVSYLMQSSEVSYETYPYIQCYNFSGISSSLWTQNRGRKSLILDQQTALEKND